MGTDYAGASPSCNQLNSARPEDYDRMLQRRDQLLEAAAAAANILLTLDNFDDAIGAALKIIVQGAGCDRLNVLENEFEGTSPLPAYCTVIYEWAGPGIIHQLDHLDAGRISNAGIEAFMAKYYLHGNGFGGLLHEWEEPLRSAFAAVQVQSSYSVPIRVNGQWWGVLCFDYCREPVRVSPAEVAVLRTIADCVGSAIHRDRTQQERALIIHQRAAEQDAYNRMLQGRDQFLATTAKAASVLLTLENFEEAINSALAIIGEGLACDFICVLENAVEPPSPLPTACNFIYEWATPGFVPLTVTFGSTTLPAEVMGTQFLADYFLEGDGFGGLLEEWHEPLRSLFASVNIQSSYAIPIRVNGQWWGVLGLDYCRAPIVIGAAQVAVLRLIADCIGNAIQRDRTQTIILQAEQTRVAELVKANTALKQSLDALATAPDLDGFIGHILQLIAHQIDAPLIDYWVHGAGVEAATSPYLHLTCWRGQVYRPPPPAAVTQGLVPFLSIPLSLGDVTLGVLVIHLPSYRPIPGQTLELAHALAQQLTLAIELTRLAEDAQQAALLQERTRLAREIHDTLAQAFGGILMQLQAAAHLSATQPEAAQSHLLTAQTLARDGLAEARRSVWTLHLESAEYEDPARAITRFIDQTAPDQGVPIELTIDGTPYRLHPDLGLNLLRIAQESITNALRHAQAQRIQLSLSYRPQTLQLTICDDGCGFDPQSPSRGFGLLGMQQRAARLGGRWHLASQPGQGTTITVTLTNPVAL